MSKVKNPLYSLGGKGTVGEVVSYARRRGVNLAENKPMPKDQRTLLQMYHRWLYEDYAYLWRVQTPATQAAYRALGSKCHLTGFQYWMSYQLTNLPDIMAWWTLDGIAGGEVSDRSRYDNVGTVSGAIPGKCAIDGALVFNGIDDIVDCGDGLSLDIPFGSLEAYFRVEGGQGTIRMIAGRDDGAKRNYYLGLNDTNTPFFILYTPTGTKVGQTTTAVSIGDTHHIIGTYDKSKVRLYLDGVLGTQIGSATADIYNKDVEFTIGRRFSVTPRAFTGAIDGIRLYNRALDQIEAETHSVRRFPLPSH